MRSLIRAEKHDRSTFLRCFLHALLHVTLYPCSAERAKSPGGRRAQVGPSDEWAARPGRGARRSTQAAEQRSKPRRTFMHFQVISFTNDCPLILYLCQLSQPGGPGRSAC